MKNTKNTKILTRICITALSMLFISAPAFTAIEFEDASLTSGLTRESETWGASLADMNGDGRPDVYVGNHRDRPSLYLSTSDGRFLAAEIYLDSTRIWLDNPISTDHHGGAWADFDNDGDQDLSAVTNGCCPDQVMVNENNVLVDRANTLGLNDSGSGWSSAWFDYNFDGRLDNLLLYYAADAILEQQQTNGTFTKSSTPQPTGCKTDNYVQFSDINGDGTLDLICVKEGTFPQKVYDFSSGSSFVDISSLVPVVSNSIDSVVADFDGDLKADIFVLRGKMRPTDAILVDQNRIEAWLDSGKDTFKNFKFNGAGQFTFSFDTRDTNVADKIFIGSSGYSPSSSIFTLDSQNTSNHGLKSNQGTQGFYVGYDSALQQWTVIISPNNSYRGYVTVDSTSVMSNISVGGLITSEIPSTPRLIKHTANGMDFDYAAGFSEPLPCSGVTSGDYDNDMDIDIYITCRHILENIPNILYENQGDGTFIKVTNAGGAEGILGIGVESHTGAAENVVSADFDVDGYLDLFVANGLKMKPTGAGGPHQLLRNKGTSNNNWILLDLVGTSSNRDGMGAKIYATAGGVTQLREQNGGYHRWSQDHQRIHFGLAANTTVDLQIEWPNGIVENHYNLPVNKLYSAVEGADITPVTLSPTPVIPLGSGDECGEPIFDNRYDRFIFLWKDCTNESWHMRISGGGDFTASAFTGSVTSSLGFNYVTPSSLEADDVVDSSNPNTIIFSLSTIENGSDGFNFAFPAGSTVCFDITSGSEILVGQQFKYGHAPLDLNTLKTCTSLTASINDVTVAESTGSADFIVALSEASTNPVTVAYETATQSGSSVVFSDDFESDLNWVTNPSSTDTATTGQWVRANPEGTTSNGAQQLDNTVSGSFDLVTGPLAGSSVGTHDIDNGVTTVRSPDITLPSTGPVTLSFSYYFAHLDNSDNADYFRVKIVGTTTLTVLEILGDGTQLDANWQQFTSNISSFSGQTIYLLIEAADGGSGSLVEAAIDDVEITGQVSASDSATEGVDYGYSSGSITFAPGELSKTISIPVYTDNTTEGIETFLVNITSNDVIISDPSGLGTILDSVTGDISCGAPIYDPSTEAAVFLWKDCSSGEWSMRVAAGGGSTALKYVGRVLNGQGFTTTTAISFEGNDILDNTTDMTILEYFMQVIGVGEDGIDFTPASGSTACLVLDGPAGIPVLLGPGKQVAPMPLDLSTLNACPTSGGNECGEPAYDPNVDNGLFIWKECLTNEWSIRVTGGGSSTALKYSGILLNNQGFDSLTPYSYESNDILDNVTDPAVIDYFMQVIGAGVDGYDFVPTAGSNACLTLDQPVGASAWLGQGKQAISFPFDINTLGMCQTSGGTECGEPVFDAATETGVFLWKDCLTDTWHMRTSGGGSSAVILYTGLLSSDTGFTSLDPFSIENSDVYNQQATSLDFGLKMIGAGMDGVDFSFSTGSNTCLDITSSPNGATVLLGGARTPITAPFDLVTQGVCQ